MSIDALEHESWFSYPWTHQQLSSITNVAQIWHFEPERKKTLPFFLFISLMPEGILPEDTVSVFTKSRLNKIVKNTAKMAKELARAELIGERRYGCVIEQFYYAPHEEDAQSFLRTLHDKKISIRTEILHDPEWTTYETSIFPSMMQRQLVQSRIYSEKMKKSGDKLAAPRRINHYIAFPNQEMRHRFMEMIRSSHYALQDEFYQPDQPCPHGLCIRNMGSIDIRSIQTYMNDLIPIVEQCQGEYEYWDCPIVRELPSNTATSNNNNS